MNWEAELGGGAGGCWDGAGVGGACASGGRSLQPPPLFRSIGPTGVSAGLPPHRRLRAVFRRSRAVLPTATSAVLPTATGAVTTSQTCVRSDGLSQAGGRLDAPARTRSLAGTLSPTPGPPHSVAPTNTGLWKPSFLSRQCGGRPCLRPAVSPESQGGAGAGSPAAAEGGVARAESRNIKKRRRRRRRKEGRREKCPGEEWRGVKEGSGGDDRALCSWLESLGLTDTPTATATANHQSWILQEAGSVKRRADPGERGAEPNRRDRRPYFLPPISQGVSLLDVPLLLPENSPPPSPCSSPCALTFPLPVPLLLPLPPKRK